MKTYSVSIQSLAGAVVSVHAAPAGGATLVLARCMVISWGQSAVTSETLKQASALTRDL